MFRRTVLVAFALIGLGASASAIPINLDPFNTDFNTLMNGIARDVAPSLRLGALSGDLQGDATIDTFNFSLLGVGLNATNGLGRVLKPGAAEWDFVLPLADLVNKNLGDSTFFEEFMVYPSMRTGFGMALGPWDVSLTGVYVPQSIVEMALGAVESDKNGTLHRLDPKFSFGNVGLQARRTLVEDSGWSSFVPAISIGGGYHYTFFDLGVTLASLEDLGMSAPSLGEGQKLDMAGTFAVTTQSQVATLDFHVSKHLLNFTPYFKFTGAYQNSTFTGNTNLVATVTHEDNSTDKQTIVAKPVVNVSDFAFLLTSGLDVNLFLVNFNFNVVSDISRAFLRVRSLSLDGIDANAFSVNAGLRIAF